MMLFGNFASLRLELLAFEVALQRAPRALIDAVWTGVDVTRWR